MASNAANRMQMRKECVERIQLSVGTELTDAQAAEILSGLRSAMEAERDANPQEWLAMGKQERAEAAMKRYQSDLLARADKMRQRARLTVIAQDRINRRAQFHRSRGYEGLSVTQACLEDVNRDVFALQNQYLTDFCQKIDGKIPGSGFLHLFEDADFANAVIREIYGENTGSKLAKNAAQAYMDVTEAQRLRFNSAGGNLGKLEHYFPQNHSVRKMAHAAEIIAGQGRLRQVANMAVNTLGKRVNRYEANKNAWVEFVFPLVDRNRYLDLNGDRMGDADMRDMLHRMYDTIITDGDNDFESSLVSGQKARTGSGTRADRGNRHRALHFKDADSFFAYRQMFGQGSVIDTAMSSIRRTAKDIAILEGLGPDPNAMVRGMERVGVDEVNQGNKKQGYLPTKVSVSLVRASWATLNGDANTIRPGREIFADVMQGARNLEVVGKLQSTLLSSVSDVATYFISARMYKVPFLRATAALVSGLGKENKALMLRAGVLADTLSQGLTRMGEGLVGQGWTGRLANATMKVSLLDAWTQLVRRASMQNMMGLLGELVQHPWDSLEPFVKMALQRAGVDADTWDLWAMARQTEVGGAKFLTTQDVLEIPLGDFRLRNGNALTQRDLNEAAKKMIVFLTDESGVASLNPDLFTRGAANAGWERGNVYGEILRSVMLFKSYPLGFMRRHLERMSDLAQTNGRFSAVKYFSTIFVATTLMGAISVQLKELAAGRDLQDMDLTNQDFWLQAMSIGGGAGFLNDIIVAGLDGQNAYGSPNMIRALGPVFNTVLDTFDVAKTAYNEAMDSRNVGLYDRETKAGAKALRLIRGHMPFVNLWYTKGVLDRAIYNDLMEAASPGYIARVQSYALRNKGSEYWWEMDSLKPRRAPRMAEAPN